MNRMFRNHTTASKFTEGTKGKGALQQYALSSIVWNHSFKIFLQGTNWWNFNG